MSEWLPVSKFDPTPGGPFVATFNDGSGATVFLCVDGGYVLDGESLAPAEQFDPVNYGLYCWLPDDFVCWGCKTENYHA